MINPVDFFRQKRPWSEYKDLILEYYLGPYIAKVARLGNPILLIDCFAGPGRFEDGKKGSPLIICDKIKPFLEKGQPIRAYFIEQNSELAERLEYNTKEFSQNVTIQKGDYRNYITDITNLAKICSTFIYVDPCKPKDFYLSDLMPVFNHISAGISVEVLINFMSSSFWRMLRASQVTADLQAGSQTSEIYDQIAGGNYWCPILESDIKQYREATPKLAQGYEQILRNWFRWAFSYPIRESYRVKVPKYHLVFGSRHEDAVELMNRAMVKARREFVGSEFVNGMLFDNRPNEEVVQPEDVLQFVKNTLENHNRITWKTCRVLTTVAYPCKYTDSEINSAIKMGIKKGVISSNCSGNKIEDKAYVWLKK